MSKDSLGNRMKSYYEDTSKTKLLRRCPVIIRIDGKSLHTFTKRFQKPFDSILMETMQETTKYLCENIQGCVLGYTQSDEINLVLTDYQTLETEAWFGNNVQKLCSVSASMATMIFNKLFTKKVQGYLGCGNICNPSYAHILSIAARKGVMFDARCFNVPKEEVANYIYWRQLDAIRNSIQMVGRVYFTDKELYKKSRTEIKDMLARKGVYWDKYSTCEKRGTCVIKEERDKKDLNDLTHENWTIDKNIPVFKDDDRYYIDRLVYPV